MSSASMEGNPSQPPAKKRKVVSEDSGSSVSGAVQDIDEVFYSRQLLVLGHEAMRRMATCDILISGLGGLGVEIAKNVILSGVKSVTLHDDTQCTVADLSTQFYLTESDIGKNRVEVSLPHLSDLNKYVPTNSFTGQLTDDVIKKFRVVVLTNSSPEERLRISEVTHANNIALVIADTKGLFGQVFCDFGESFTVVDTNGESPRVSAVSYITRGADGVVTCLRNTPHGLEDGDYVTFSDILGMTELNNCQPRKVTVIGPHKFSIGDTSAFSEYSSGGIVTQVKMPKQLHFEPLSEALQHPEYLVTDFAKCDRPAQLHLAFATLHKFVARHGALPRPWNNADARKFTSLAESLNSEGTKLDVALLETFAKISSGSLGPINAAIGGIVAQEVIKACSGKFNPIHQWLYFDALECLPTNLDDIKEEDCQATGSRYDGQTAIFGKPFQDRLGALKYFVVGAGAIGCELLKNFAMMGVGAGKSGQVTVTDDGKIKECNLNTQFLFRPADVQCSKSLTAASAVRRMNPAMNVEAHENQVSDETNHLYDDEFFATLDGVANAVDNIDARWHIDDRCWFNGKPTIDSGIFGTKGSIHVVVPYLTEKYSSSRDPVTKFIPYSPEHTPFVTEKTIYWARSKLYTWFRKPYVDAKEYLIDPEYTSDCSVEQLQSIKLALIDQRPRSFQDCVAWARRCWQEEFTIQIQKIILKLPADNPTVIVEPQQVGIRRSLVPLEFSLDEPDHLDFVVAAANLLAEVYGIEQVRDRERITQMVQQVSLPEFDPLAKKRARHIQLFTNVSGQHLTPLQHIKPLHRVKTDSDTNFHIDFIVATSRLRAANLNIAPASRYMARMILEKVTPAITSTSSVVAGLACLELIKVVQGHQTLSPYKNGYVNLALPFLGFSEPIAAHKINFNGTEMSMWEHLEVGGEMTLGEFIAYFHEKFKMRVHIMWKGKFEFYDDLLMFNDDLGEECVNKELMGMTMREMWQLETKKQLEPNVRELEFMMECYAEDGDRVLEFLVRYNLPDTR